MNPIASLALIVGIAAGLGNAQVVSSVYAQFCDDTACSTNCGESVSVNNPGCLAETGRNSVFFHGGYGSEAIQLVASPDNACSCQSDCHPDVVHGAVNNCYGISPDSAAQSFRFQSQECGANNC